MFRVFKQFTTAAIILASYLKSTMFKMIINNNNNHNHNHIIIIITINNNNIVMEDLGTISEGLNRNVIGSAKILRALEI